MSLASELQAEQVAHMDLSGFSVVEAGSSVRSVLEKLRSEKHNVCLITEQGTLVGIFTDRDVLKRVVLSPEVLDGPVDAVMTSEPTVINPTASAAEALRLMDEHHIRNLPAVDEDGRIQGDMTHAAVLDYLAARYPVEVLNRPLDPERFPRKQEGG